MSKKYLIAKTYKKKGSAAILLEKVPDFLAYIPQLESIFKRNAEFLIISTETDKTLDEAWPEYAPFEEATTKLDFERVVTEKTAREKKG